MTIGTVCRLPQWTSNPWQHNLIAVFVSHCSLLTHNFSEFCIRHLAARPDTIFETTGCKTRWVEAIVRWRQKYLQGWQVQFITHIEKTWDWNFHMTTNSSWLSSSTSLSSSSLPQLLTQQSDVDFEMEQGLKLTVEAKLITVTVLQLHWWR